MKLSFALLIFLSVLTTGDYAKAGLGTKGNECLKEAGDKNKWVLFFMDDRQYHCFNDSELYKTKAEIVGTWVKLVPRSHEVVDHWRQVRRNGAFLMDGYEDLQYLVVALEIDCIEKKSALIEQRDYAKALKLLDRVRTPLRNWQEIRPGSHHDFYRMTFCEKLKIPTQEN